MLILVFSFICLFILVFVFPLAFRKFNLRSPCLIGAFIISSFNILSLPYTCAVRKFTPSADALLLGSFYFLSSVLVVFVAFIASEILKLKSSRSFEFDLNRPGFLFPLVILWVLFFCNFLSFDGSGLREISRILQDAGNLRSIASKQFTVFWVFFVVIYALLSAEVARVASLRPLFVQVFCLSAVIFLALLMGQRGLAIIPLSWFLWHNFTVLKAFTALIFGVPVLVITAWGRGLPLEKVASEALERFDSLYNFLFYFDVELFDKLDASLVMERAIFSIFPKALLVNKPEPPSRIIQSLFESGGGILPMNYSATIFLDFVVLGTFWTALSFLFCFCVYFFLFCLLKRSCLFLIWPLLMLDFDFILEGFSGLKFQNLLANVFILFFLVWILKGFVFFRSVIHRLVFPRSVVPC